MQNMLIDNQNGNERNLVLASESPFRKQVLIDAGYEFKIMPAHINEKEIRSESPHTLTSALAQAKGVEIVRKLQSMESKACIISSDQVVYWNNKILEKPESRMEARQQLENYRISNLATVTAVQVWNMYNGKSAIEVEEVEIKVIPFSDSEISIILDAVELYLAVFQIAQHLL